MPQSSSPRISLKKKHTTINALSAGPARTVKFNLSFFLSLRNSFSSFSDGSKRKSSTLIPILYREVTPGRVWLTSFVPNRPSFRGRRSAHIYLYSPRIPRGTKAIRESVAL
uniref:Orf29 n=1 Tax=Daucus carota subsp. sativus TaxID=79200 RepID=I1TID7_DAUCS|nr:orf29 [Daucus carota subsp. sativus]AEY81167.1 orf29 [Daucus carota subsp. sativus]